MINFTHFDFNRAIYCLNVGKIPPKYISLCKHVLDAVLINDKFIITNMNVPLL